MAVTLKEIAQDVGVSVVTVSKVLRNHEDIGQRTRELVLQRAAELGYRPNLTARSLVTGRSSLVGLLVPDLIHPFFAEVARSLAAKLRTEGIYLLICSSEGDPELERHQLEHLASRRLDAIVVASVGSDGRELKYVADSGTPLVLIDRKADIDKAHFVGVDDFAVGMLATEHLLAMGCTRIAHLRGPANSVGDRRLEGYKHALSSAGVPFQPAWVTEASSGDAESKLQGAQHATALFSQPVRPDGLFCFSDPMAIGAMQAALALGVAIPDEVAIVGCGNLHYDDVLRIPLSSVDQQSALIGDHAAQLILQQVLRRREDASVPAGGLFASVQLQPELVVRDSSRRVML